jgi:hypothetical protein
MERGLRGSTMSQGMRTGAIILLVFLIEACVRVGHIQQTEPIRTLQFTGSHRDVAQCVHRRLGGKVQDESFGERYVIYDSVKRQAQEGLSHYSITVGKTGPDQGFAEWRVIRPVSSIGKTPPLTIGTLRDYWNPVEDCAAQAKSSPAPRS